MARTIAGITALLVFAVCAIVGANAGNTFSTAVGRALVAMAGTFVIGLIVGAMGQKMMDERKAQEDKLKEKSTESQPSDR
jgi:hypothetical protein